MSDTELLPKPKVGSEPAPAVQFTWRREVQRVRAGASRMAFAPVILEAARSCADAEPMAPGQSVGSLAIEIIIGAATVRVPPGTELAALQLVLRALTTTP